MSNGWIGVDFDGTLAHHAAGAGLEPLGEPIPLMLERVLSWVIAGVEVRIVTARVSHDEESNSRQRTLIEDWCLTHIGRILPVTNQKDFGMFQLWDDRAIQVERNTGRIIGEPEKHHDAAN